MTFAELTAFLKSIETHSLPGEDAHFDVLPINRPISSTILDLTGYRNSAVALYLFERGNSVRMTLIQRPIYDGPHSNQIALPGGKQDPGDPDLIYTALREGMEEIGQNPNECEFILPLTPVHVPISKFSIHPMIFQLAKAPIYVPDAREVARVFDFELEHLLRDDILQRRDLDLGSGFIRKNIPGFHIDNETFVWGATAMILSEFRSLLRSI